MTRVSTVGRFSRSRAILFCFSVFFFFFSGFSSERWNDRQPSRRVSISIFFKPIALAEFLPSFFYRVFILLPSFLPFTELFTEFSPVYRVFFRLPSFYRVFFLLPNFLQLIEFFTKFSSFYRVFFHLPSFFTEFSSFYRVFFHLLSFFTDFFLLPSSYRVFFR